MNDVQYLLNLDFAASLPLFVTHRNTEEIQSHIVIQHDKESCDKTNSLMRTL